MILRRYCLLCTLCTASTLTITQRPSKSSRRAMMVPPYPEGFEDEDLEDEGGWHVDDCGHCGASAEAIEQHLLEHGVPEDAVELR